MSWLSIQLKPFVARLPPSQQISGFIGHVSSHIQEVRLYGQSPPLSAIPSKPSKPSSVVDTSSEYAPIVNTFHACAGLSTGEVRLVPGYGTTLNSFVSTFPALTRRSLLSSSSSPTATDSLSSCADHDVGEPSVMPPSSVTAMQKTLLEAGCAISISLMASWVTTPNMFRSFMPGGGKILTDSMECPIVTGLCSRTAALRSLNSAMPAMLVPCPRSSELDHPLRAARTAPSRIAGQSNGWLAFSPVSRRQTEVPVMSTFRRPTRSSTSSFWKRASALMKAEVGSAARRISETEPTPRNMLWMPLSSSFAITTTHSGKTR